MERAVHNSSIRTIRVEGVEKTPEVLEYIKDHEHKIDAQDLEINSMVSIAFSAIGVSFPILVPHEDFQVNDKGERLNDGADKGKVLTIRTKSKIKYEMFDRVIEIAKSLKESGISGEDLQTTINEDVARLYGTKIS